MIPYVTIPISMQEPRVLTLFRYKIGDSFVSLPLPDVQSMLSSTTEDIDKDVSVLEEKLGGIREEMQQLKVALYARFGKSINLET